MPHESYASVPYPSHAFAQSHPDRLASRAILFGMKPAPVERCRVLELGCNNGTNLLPMALSLPDSQFVGVEINADAIAEGQAVAAEIGLKNLTLKAMDLAAVTAELGPFDYIVAHGVYSWVPAPVRDRILAVCGELLAPHGVAYISYHVYPGGYNRKMVRDILLYHIRDMADPSARIEQAKDLLGFLAEAVPPSARHKAAFQAEWDLVRKNADSHFYHDLLADNNDPVFFHEFMANARRYRLQYLTDAIDEGPADQTPTATIAKLCELSNNDPLLLEQYFDFLTARVFRQSLLCREDAPRQRTFQADRMRDLLLGCSAKPVSSAQPDLAPGVSEEFRNNAGTTIAVEDALLKAALVCLGETWPYCVPFADLLDRVRTRLKQPDADAQALCEELLAAHRAEFVGVRTFQPRFVMTPGAKPTASPLVRWQAQRGASLTNLCHLPVQVSDMMTRLLLTLMDGTRDRPALVEGLCEYMTATGVNLKDKGQDITDPARVRQILAGVIDLNITKLASQYLLLA